MELVQLRHRATCAVCASKLPPRSEAWHDEASKRTVCPTCHRVQSQPAQPDSHRSPRLVGPHGEHVNVGGGASQPTGPGSPSRLDLEHDIDLALEAQDAAAVRAAEEERLTQARLEQEKLADLNRDSAATKAGVNNPRRGRFGGVLSRSSQLPLVGPSLAAGVEADREIESGSQDGNNIVRALEAARPHGLEIIQSRPWRGTRVDSEAIVVGPSGIWVVDGLGAAGEPVEKGFLSGHAGSELLNVVGGRTSIITGLLFDSPFQWVPVRGALCFDGRTPSWFDTPFNLAGISITTARDLVDSLFSPLHLDADTRQKVAQHLVNRF